MSKLTERNLPQVLKMKSGAMAKNAEDWSVRRSEILNVLESDLFGALPAVECKMTYSVKWEESKFYHCGKSILRVITATASAGGKCYSWDMTCVLPKSEKKVPIFMLMGYGDRLSLLGVTPTEELVDGGFGAAILDYGQISSDDGDFTNGLAAMFYPDGVRGEHDGGKIAIWAWAMSRSLDYLLTMPEIDTDRVYAVGHSRLGKTALWAAAVDERFGGVYSVNSGCSGAAIARGNTGEKVSDITTQFPFWFAPTYAGYADCVEEMPFDQHYLLALIAPRKLYVSSAAADLWADPLGEYLGCIAVTPVYELLGKGGISEEKELGDDAIEHGSDVGYHRRPGTHFFGRLDWQRAMMFFGQEA